MRYFILKLAFICTFFISFSAGASELSKDAKELIYKVTTIRARAPDSVCKKPITQNTKSNALKIQKDLKWEGAPKLKKYLDAVPKAEQKKPKVKIAADKARKYLDCLKHIEIGLKQVEATTGLVKKFMKATDGTEGTMKKLHEFSKNENVTMWTSNPVEMQRWKDDLEKIYTQCLKYKGVEKVSNRGNAIYDPSVRCKVAAKREVVMKQLAKNLVAKRTSMLVSTFEKEIKTFDQHNGYLRLDSAAEYTAFLKPNEMKKKVSESMAPILAIAGVSAGNLWVDFDKVHGQLWQKIKNAGKSWKAPKREGSQKSAIVAAKKRFKEHKVKRAFMTRNSWNIHKDGRGRTLSRTKVGYIIFKVKGDKRLAGSLCRGRSFTYLEKYVNGKFKKSKEISELSFIRFESCK